MHQYMLIMYAIIAEYTLYSDYSGCNRLLASMLHIIISSSSNNNSRLTGDAVDTGTTVSEADGSICVICV